MDKYNTAILDDKNKMSDTAVVKSFEKQELTDNHNIKQYICD